MMTTCACRMYEVHSLSTRGPFFTEGQFLVLKSLTKLLTG